MQHFFKKNHKKVSKHKVKQEETEEKLLSTAFD